MTLLACMILATAWDYRPQERPEEKPEGCQHRAAIDSLTTALDEHKQQLLECAKQSSQVININHK